MSAAKDQLARGAKSAMFLPKEIDVRAGVDAPREMDEDEARTELSKIILKEFDEDNPEELNVARCGLENLYNSFNLKDPAAFGIAERAARRIANSRKAMSPAGSLHLPEMLEERRWEYMIPDGAFKIQPFHDRIFVFQKEWVDGPSFEDGLIMQSEQGLRREQESAPEGVLVAAGLKALDELRANGIDLGHHVSFIRQAPWRMLVSRVDGREKYVLLLMCGDITGSFDLMNQLKDGSVRVEHDDDAMQHYYTDSDGVQWRPAYVSPLVPEDY